MPLVSTPLAWGEVERRGSQLYFGPAEALERIERLGDLFAGADPRPAAPQATAF